MKSEKQEIGEGEEGIGKWKQKTGLRTIENKDPKAETVAKE